MTKSSILSWGTFASLLLIFATMLVAGGPGASLDRDILFLAQMKSLAPAARVASDVGSWVGVLIVTAATAAWLVAKRRRRDALVLACLMISERPLVELLKIFFDRARPDPHGHLVAVKSMAFPSGHSANAAALGIGLALIAAPPHWRVPALILGLSFAAAVGLSRLVLGVHWPSDVVGGWALGAAWALLLARFARGTSGAQRH